VNGKGGAKGLHSRSICQLGLRHCFKKSQLIWLEWKGFQPSSRYQHYS